MRELTQQEIEQVDGGWVPLAMWGLSFAGKMMARSLAQWAVGSASLVGGTYEAAVWASNK